MRQIRILKQVLAVILAVMLTLGTGSVLADSGSWRVFTVSETTDWGDYGRMQLVSVVEWTPDMAETYYVNATPEGKWVMAVLQILDGGQFPLDALLLGFDILRLDDSPVAQCAASGAIQDRSTGDYAWIGTIAYFFDVPPDYDPAGGVVTICNPVHDIAWGDYGRVRLTSLTEWTADMAETYFTDAVPEGKWALAVFTILDGGSFPTDALNLAYDHLRLDDYPVARCSTYGGSQNAATGEIRLTGTLAFFFDVPADYDFVMSTVTFDDAVVTVAAE